MILLYAWLSSLLIVLGLFLWQVYMSRRVTSQPYASSDLPRLLLLCLLLVAVINFVLLLFYLL